MAKLNFDLTGVPKVVLEHPAMMTELEKIMLYHLARENFTGEGVIIDAGLFLCASTVAFARGILDNEALQGGRWLKTSVKPIQSYDIALWHTSMNSHLGNPAVRNALNDVSAPEAGASFQPLLERIVEPYAGLVDLHIGDIRETLVCDRPVEIAFYDCMKSGSIEKAVFKAVGPHLRKNSIVIQQDYFYDRAVELKIRQEFFAEYFDFLGQCGGSGIFKMVSPIPNRYFQKDPLSKLSFDEQARLLRQAAERPTGRRPRMYTLLSLADFYLKHNKTKLSWDVTEEVTSLAEGAEKSDLTQRILRRLGEIRNKCRVTPPQ